MKFLWMVLLSVSLQAQDSFLDHIVGGDVHLDLRFRIEHVTQDDLSRDATATTLRTRLGYETDAYRGFQVLVEFENVLALNDEIYNDTDNGLAQRPVIADPADTEVNRLKLSYAWSEEGRILVGRQRIIHDNARFVGNVGWRQNEQTFDALTVEHSGWLGWQWQASFLDNVNRIFGEHHSRLSDTRLHGGLVHLQRNPWRGATLSLFAHFLDFAANHAQSHRNLGFYLRGTWPPKAKRSLVYEASWVDQVSYKGGANVIDVDYKSSALGYRDGPWQVEVHIEYLDSNGQYGFATPLATLHAFNGWADVFLNTPALGLEDRFLKLQWREKPWQAVLIYHDFQAASGPLDYGSEWDLSVGRSIGQHGRVLLKAADYRANAVATDRTKLWCQIQCQW